MLDEGRRGKIPENLGASRNTLRFKPAMRNAVGHSLPFPLINNQNAAATGVGPAAAYVCVRSAYNSKKVARSKRDNGRSPHHGDVTDYIRAAMTQALHFDRIWLSGSPVLVPELGAG
jgi:hypothetical protein